MTKWNGMNAVKVDLAKSGICETCGRRFTDILCTHGTPEQIDYTVELDAQIEAEYEQKRQARELSKQAAWLNESVNLPRAYPASAFARSAFPSIEEVTVNGYAFNSTRAQAENQARAQLASDYNKLFGG